MWFIRTHICLVRVQVLLVLIAMVIIPSPLVLQRVVLVQYRMQSVAPRISGAARIDELTGRRASANPHTPRLALFGG
jgi:hypothetical protein